MFANVKRRLEPNTPDWNVVFRCKLNPDSSRIGVGIRIVCTELMPEDGEKIRAGADLLLLIGLHSVALWRLAGTCLDCQYINIYMT